MMLCEWDIPIEGADELDVDELLRQLEAARREAAGRRAWGKRMARLASKFQSEAAHNFVQMERFREQAKVTDRLRREQGEHYRRLLAERTSE